MTKKVKLTERIIFISFFLILGSAVTLLTSLNDMDSNLHLDYVREIQRTGTIPVYHPHLFRTEAIQIPFPYPIGYHLAMSVFPHWVPLYKVLGVTFAAISLLLVLKLHKLLGFGGNLAVLTPLALASSFSEFTVAPHPDMFALALVLLSVYSTLKYTLEGKTAYVAIAVLSGFYASMVREVALMTLLFAWFVFWIKYGGSRRRLFWTIVPIILFTVSGYYVINSMRGVHFLYPLRGAIDPRAQQWYLTHVSFWSVLRHGYWSQTIGEIVKVFSLFIPLFLLTKPQDRGLALAFGCQVAFIFILMPSTAGLDRYVMFTLPFLTIAYGNVFRNYRRWLPFLLVGVIILYPVQGRYIEGRIPDDFEEIVQHLDQNDFALCREQAQLAYRVGCRAGWTSLFWSGDLYDSFENVNRLDDLIEKHGITHVVIDKRLIIPARGPMIGNEAVGYPEDWVERVKNIGIKVHETKHYVLYRVG